MRALRLLLGMGWLPQGGSLALQKAALPYSNVEAIRVRAARLERWLSLSGWRCWRADAADEAKKGCVCCDACCGVGRHWRCH